VTIPPALQPLVDDARHAVVLVDFDGSLAPIVADPASSRPLPAAREALAGLVPLVDRVAVVSGRPVAFLVDTLGIDGIVYAGLYGLERIVDGEVVVDARAEPWLDVMTQVAHDADAAFPDLLVEHKGRHSRPASPGATTSTSRYAVGCRSSCDRRFPSTRAR
jgi:trehalose 6-phosphate phosphatase